MTLIVVIFIIAFAWFMALLDFIFSLVKATVDIYPQGSNERREHVIYRWYLCLSSFIVIPAIDYYIHRPPSHSKEKREELDSVNSSSSSKADEPKTRTDE